LIGAAAGCWIAATTVVAESQASWGHGPVIGLLVAGAFSLLAGVLVLRWNVKPARPKDEGTAERLASLLQRSYEQRDRVRHASDRQVVFEACQSFIELGLDAEKLLRDDAPEYASDFQAASRAPWGLQGKTEVLRIMDARLRVHSEIVKRLRRRDQ
jgi:hypothetical protein